MEEREPSGAAGGNVNWFSLYGEQLCRFLKKPKTELPCDPAIPLMGIYPEESVIQNDTRAPMSMAALFTIARTWKQTSINRRMDNDICHGILLSHKKKWNWVTCGDVERPHHHTEWSKSEREKQVSYINAYMWNLKNNWYRQSYLQSRNRDTDIENKHGYQEGRVGGWMIGRWRLIHTHCWCVLVTQSNPINCSPPGSSVHGVLQARILD